MIKNSTSYRRLADSPTVKDKYAAVPQMVDARDETREPASDTHVHHLALYLNNKGDKHDHKQLRVKVDGDGQEYLSTGDGLFKPGKTGFSPAKLAEKVRPRTKSIQVYSGKDYLKRITTPYLDVYHPEGTDAVRDAANKLHDVYMQGRSTIGELRGAVLLLDQAIKRRDAKPEPGSVERETADIGSSELPVDTDVIDNVTADNDPANRPH